MPGDAGLGLGAGYCPVGEVFLIIVFFAPGPLDAEPGFYYPTGMRTCIRMVCLGLCLVLSSPVAWGKTEDSERKTTQSQSKSKSKSSSKSKKGSESSKGKSKRKVSQPKQPAGSFKGIAWGAPLSVLSEPDLREEDGDLKYYTVPGDDMDVLGVHMREIAYVFCKGKFSGALARYDGQVNHLILLGKLKDAYGTPLESPPNVLGDRSWRFDVDEQTAIMMEYAENPATGALAWMNKGQLSPCQQGAP